MSYYNPRSASFETLSDDVLVIIMKFLDLQTLENLALTCKRMLGIYQSPSIASGNEQLWQFFQQKLLTRPKLQQAMQHFLTRNPAEMLTLLNRAFGLEHGQNYVQAILRNHFTTDEPMRARYPQLALSGPLQFSQLPRDQLRILRAFIANLGAFEEWLLPLPSDPLPPTTNITPYQPITNHAVVIPQPQYIYSPIKIIASFLLLGFMIFGALYLGLKITERDIKNGDISNLVMTILCSCTTLFMIGVLYKIRDELTALFNDISEFFSAFHRKEIYEFLCRELGIAESTPANETTPLLGVAALP